MNLPVPTMAGSVEKSHGLSASTARLYPWVPEKPFHRGMNVRSGDTVQVVRGCDGLSRAP